MMLRAFSPVEKARVRIEAKALAEKLDRW